MMKTFYVKSYRDSFQVMQEALEKLSGWKRVKKPDMADVVFLDREPTGNEIKWNRINELAKNKPVFIYPHTPYSSWLWDGYTEPSKNIACNFVCNEAGLKIMDSYGYPCRKENIGFSRPLTVKPFSSTSGNVLGYSGPRLLGAEGRFYRSGDEVYVKRTMDWIVENRHWFFEIKVFYSFSLKIYGLEEYKKYSCIEFINVAEDSIATNDLGTMTALNQLKGIVGSNTLGYIALSQGIPTILIGHNNDVPLHSTNNGIHYVDYAEWCDFPIRLEDMDGNDALEYCLEEPGEVLEWKKMNIENFNAEKFLRTVEEYC